MHSEEISGYCSTELASVLEIDSLTTHGGMRLHSVIARRGSNGNRINREGGDV